MDKQDDNATSILIVDDDKNVLEVLEARLISAGFATHRAENGRTALRLLKENRIDLMISDMKMPGMSGMEVLTKARTIQPGLPIIFLTAYGTIPDAVKAVKAGAVDYLAKPFLPRELVIRVHRLLERVYKPAQIKNSVININPYVLDENKRIILKGRSNIELTSKEFDLVLFFAKHKGQALSREQIINRVWGEEHIGTDRSVDDLVRRLRKKMSELHIETLYGFGYRMTDQ